MSNYPAGYNEPESLDHYLERLEDGEPCFHPGCLNHVTHPCEGCGRIAGKAPQEAQTETPNAGGQPTAQK
jgi:hypothetical protein